MTLANKVMISLPNTSGSPANVLFYSQWDYQPGIWEGEDGVTG